MCSTLFPLFHLLYFKPCLHAKPGGSVCSVSEEFGAFRAFNAEKGGISPTTNYENSLMFSPIIQSIHWGQDDERLQRQTHVFRVNVLLSSSTSTNATTNLKTQTVKVSKPSVWAD